MGVWYTTRETVMASPDIKASAYLAREIDRHIEAGSRNVEKLCHRIFYPLAATKTFDWPNAQNARSGRLWLDGNELISASSVQSPTGTLIDPDAVFLEPAASGPPYNRIELDRATSASFSLDGGTEQRSISITGVYSGCPIAEETAGALSSSVSSGDTAISGTKAYGVGDLLRCGSEYMIITEKSWVTTGQTGTLASSNAAQVLAVSDGTAFSVWDELLIDAERVFVVDIAGNNLIVRRAASGSTLAAHAAATIYAARRLTVTRGAAGTTVASHATSDPLYRYLAPGPVVELATAYAVSGLLQAQSGYARTIGQGDNERALGRGAVAELEARVYSGYGRKNRMRAV